MSQLALLDVAHWGQLRHCEARRGRSGSLIRRVESIAKPAGPATAWPVFVFHKRKVAFNMPTIAIILVAVAVFGFLLLSSTIKIVQEYERGVIFRLGRLVGARGPGLFFLIPGVERMRKVDLRIVTLEVPAQEAITRDNVTVKVNAVVYFRVVDPEEAVVKVLDYIRATSLIGQTTLRSILGQSDLDHLLSERDKINAELQQVIDTQTSAWGVKVTSVEVRDLELPQSMQRAMARQAEAEREKRAKVIHAEGEFSASQQLANAAKVIGSQPATLQLRYLQTLTEIAAEKNSTIVFPLPLELLQGFFNLPPANVSAGGVNGNVPQAPTPV
jgi:regulator of protease activity HflC (stomatin/prohibitin superfamily)